MQFHVKEQLNVSGNTKMYLDLHLKWSIFLPHFNQILIFLKVPSIRFHGNLSFVTHADTCRQMDVTTLISTFCTCANVPNKAIKSRRVEWVCHAMVTEMWEYIGNMTQKSLNRQDNLQDPDTNSLYYSVIRMDFKEVRHGLDLTCSW